MEGAFEKALNYTKEREQFGKPIANFQAVQFFTWAEMAIKIAATKILPLASLSALMPVLHACMQNRHDNSEESLNKT